MCDQETVFVRIIELPTAKMVRSGDGDLDVFDRWWSALSAQENNRLFPHDFMWFNPQLNSFEWLYVLPEGLQDTGGYEEFDFPGGLYAVAACKDDGPEIDRTNRLIHRWIAHSEVFEEVPHSKDAGARYDMGHIITPHNAKETIGYHQMDLFVPMVYRDRQK